MNTKGYLIRHLTVFRLAWLVYIAVISIRCALHGYARYGVGGLVFGLVVGTFLGVMSAYIVSFLLAIIVKTGSTILGRCKSSVRKKL